MVRVNARLSPQQQRQVEEICAATGLSVSDAMRAAISAYHQRVVQPARNASEALREVGFIGCADAAPENHPDIAPRDELTAYLSKKHGYR